MTGSSLKTSSATSSPRRYPAIPPSVPVRRGTPNLTPAVRGVVGGTPETAADPKEYPPIKVGTDSAVGIASFCIPCRKVPT